MVKSAASRPGDLRKLRWRKSTLQFRLLFSYTPTRVQYSANPALRFHASLQELRRKHSGAGGHDTGYLDCCAMPTLRCQEKLSSIRDLSRQAVIQTWPKARCGPRCTDGRNEASHCAGAGGLGGANARADANEVDTGHCRRDHCGRSSGAGPGYQPAVSSSDGCGVREREPGANDLGSRGPTVMRSPRFTCGRYGRRSDKQRIAEWF